MGVARFNVIFFLLAFFVALSPVEARKKRRSKKAQWAKIAVEGAAVYQKPDFDAPIIGYLEKSKKVRASRKIYRSETGFGLFYKVRMKKRTYGYVADNELIPQYKPKNVPMPKRSGSLDPLEAVDPNIDLEKESENDPFGLPTPVYAQKFIGVGFGTINYSEKIDGKTLASNSTVFGLKVNGAGALFDGPPVDLTVAFGLAAPDYYDRVSDDYSGFFIVGDLMLNLPFMDWKDGMIFYGMGPIFTYSRFEVDVVGTTLDAEELRLGAGLVIGLTQSLGKRWAIRAEGKYFFEVTAYTGFMISAQYRY